MSDVPHGPALAFALEGAHPNPARGGESGVAFTLPDGAPAQLELVDVSGQRWGRREVGSMGAGRHVVPLGGSRRLPPGLYLVRLTRGAHALVVRAVVLE